MTDIKYPLNISEIDFYQIKENLKKFLRSKPELQDYDFEGSGWSYLLDLLSYNSAYTSFYLNMIANESFLDSAVTRDAVVSKAKLLGYVPGSKKAARAKLKIELKPVSSIPTKIELPRTCMFLGTNDENEYDFVITEPKTLYFNSPDGSPSDWDSSLGKYVTEIDVIEGQRLTYRFTVTADPYQRFVIPNTDIDITTLVVTVQESETNPTLHLFERAEDITELSSNTRAYFIQQTDDNLYELYFGDDILSASVKSNNIIIIDYIVCNGSLSNGIKEFSDADQDNYIVTPADARVNSVITTVSNATGGEEEEDLKSIKFFAPINYEQQNRAVTKLDFENLLEKEYPRIDSVMVWGGEDNDPPEYGKVFVCIKPSEGYVLEQSEKDYIIENIIKPKRTLCQKPEIVDPDYTYLIVNTRVKFNYRDSVKLKQEIQSAVYNTIINYGNTELDKFGRGIEFSKFSAMIDDVDTGIISNNTRFELKKIIYPTLKVPEYYIIKFVNQLDVFDTRNAYGKAVYSSNFYYLSNSTVCFFAEDSFGSKILSMFRINALTNKIIKVKEFGTIDYDKGLINITVKFVPVGWINNVSRIEFYAKPKSTDITSLRNQILVIDERDVVVDVDEKGFI